MARICLDKDWLQEYPAVVRRAVRSVTGVYPEVYVAGGAVRDWLSGFSAGDLDLTVNGDGIKAARLFAEAAGGVFVLLDEREKVARVVADGLTVDIASFREGTCNINDDLALRDFSINAMAVAVDPGSGTLAKPFTVLDPQGGADDLARGIVRAADVAVFASDPLRLLRAYRFSATSGFLLDPKTSGWIKEKSSLLKRSAPERINYELNLIMASGRATESIRRMDEAGLLGKIFPELMLGKGLEQPASHHLDVLEHNLAALAASEIVISSPDEYFPDHAEQFVAYLARKNMPLLIKWAALFHDLGKPEVFETRDDGRATFYNHDRAGAELFGEIARRLRWSKDRIRIVSGLIGAHMYPFHLSNAMLKTGITPRACLRLVKTAGDDLPGLFILAMADSLASQGPLRPPEMEANLVSLYAKIDQVYGESIKSVLAGPPLLTGRYLIEMGLEPGPIYGRILDGIEQARVAGEIDDRQQAVAWVKDFLAEENAVDD
ncbi:MAG: HD domain-containing protein [Thermodesulfobacteriota bacterium]